MKLSLDQLKVDSYATQVSENELTDVKGGTTIYCTIGGAILSNIIAYYVASDSGSPGLSGQAGSTTIEVNGNAIQIDSLTTNGVYGIRIGQ